MSINCELCSIQYKSTNALMRHNLTHHSDTINNTKLQQTEKRKYYCSNCNKPYASRQSKWKHEGTCNVNQNVLTNEKEQNTKAKNNLVQNNTITNKINKPTNHNNSEYFITKNNSANIMIRTDNNYVDGNHMCEQYNKKLNDWLEFNITETQINELAKIKNLPQSQLIINDKPFVWICQELAIQLAQWLSPLYGIKINACLLNHNLQIQNEIVKPQNNPEILNEKNENLKKQKRVQFPKYVVYALTTKFYKQSKTYIIGKATNLTTRLSTYNKTAEHEVVYYRKCNNPDVLEIAEKIILMKLGEFREQSNRDRFVLPKNLDATYIINIINHVLDYFDKPHQPIKAEILL